MSYHYGVNIFKISKKGVLKLVEEYASVEDVVELTEKRIPQENIWNNASETFTIFANKDGIGFEHVIPGGYSEYTYDPTTTTNFYLGVTLDWFINFALSENERELVSVNDLTLIRLSLPGIQEVKK